MRSQRRNAGSKRCFAMEFRRMPFVKWKIFTSEQDYLSYVETGKHRR
jgi:hypothetical protein